MSISVTLYKNESPKNAINKNLTNLGVLNVNFKDNADLSNIILIVERNNYVLNCNYVYLSTLNKYYFITDKKILRNMIVELKGEIDLLMTYKNEIKVCTGIVKRQQNEYNLDLNDGSLKVYQNPHIITKPFPSGFTGSSYVLAVAGA